MILCFFIHIGSRVLAVFIHIGSRVFTSLYILAVQGSRGLMDRASDLCFFVYSRHCRAPRLGG